jgi:integrase
VESTKCDTEAGARQRLRQRLEEIGRNQFLPSKTPLIREAALEWLEAKKITASRMGGPLKESTLLYWENHVKKYINPVLGDYRSDRVDTRMVENARDIWKTMGLAGKSVNKVMSTLQVIFRKQIALGVLRFNPVEAAARLASQPKEPGEEWAYDIFTVHHEEVYTPEELFLLLQGAKPGFDEVFLNTIALTMARRGEILGLMWSDVDLETKEIAIRRSWGGKYRDGKPVFWLPKTKSGMRIVPIPDQLVALLARWKLQNPPGTHDLVLARANGLPYPQSAAYHAHKNACEASGVRRLRLHALRHTGASIHLMAGTPIPDVSAMLGHARMDVTLQVYSHFIPQMRSASASRLADAVFSAGKALAESQQVLRKSKTEGEKS